MLLDPLPPPRELFRAFESGSMSREVFQQCMAAHARELIAEMEEAHGNPLAAFVEQMFNRYEASKLMARHGEPLVREVLHTLADQPDFPPARWLWNAQHPHVPLHIFFRTRRAPRFRILKMEAWPQRISLQLEHGGENGSPVIVEQVEMRRLKTGMLVVEHRLKKF